ncbi:uncharacterized protein LOC119726906 [Patiria miniata]|uniref:Tyrosine phosphatase n=1 Tax=Patiria miniata TaxID=46514 RepID=A0A913ZUD3_PATMI|nr:uncharacterized protein LOC119726906 [Patiria miniata]
MVTPSFNPSEASEVGIPVENVILLDSVPNLRRVDAHGKLFRSSRQDRATEEDVQVLYKSLGIRSYLDFRSVHEYCTIDSGKTKAIDGTVPVFVPDIPDPKTTRHYPTDSTSVKDVNGKPVSKVSSPRRYLINMFPRDAVLEVFNMAPWYKRIFTVLCVLIGILTGNHYLYFTRCLSVEIIRHGLIGRYKGFLKYGSKEICFSKSYKYCNKCYLFLAFPDHSKSIMWFGHFLRELVMDSTITPTLTSYSCLTPVLKTICNPENLPAILCCTHGKDRTGIVTALVLSILGKSNEYIAEEYSLSEKGLEPIMPEVKEVALRYIPDESFLYSRKETMLKLLAATRETYGSVENYLESIGFGKDDQDKLRQALS